MISFRRALKDDGHTVHLIQRSRVSDEGIFIRTTDRCSMVISDIEMRLMGIDIKEIEKRLQPRTEIVIWRSGSGMHMRGIAIDQEMIIYAEGKGYEQMIAEKASDHIAYHSRPMDEEDEIRLGKLPKELGDRVRAMIDLGFIEPRLARAEMFASEQALIILDHFDRDLNRILRFAEESLGDQLDMVPELSIMNNDATLSMACYLAHIMITDPAEAMKSHGIGCRQAGCKNYHCLRSVKVGFVADDPTEHTSSFFPA